MDKRLHPHLSQESDFGITKDVKGMIISDIAAKYYNPLLPNSIEPEIKNTLRKNLNSFWRNQSTTSQILTIR